jgi:hypothetical protein
MASCFIRRESSKNKCPRSGQNFDIDPLRGDFSINWIPACAGTCFFGVRRLVCALGKRRHVAALQNNATSTQSKMNNMNCLRNMDGHDGQDKKQSCASALSASSSFTRHMAGEISGCRRKRKNPEKFQSVAGQIIPTF